MNRIGHQSLTVTTNTAVLADLKQISLVGDMTVAVATVYPKVSEAAGCVLAWSRRRQPSAGVQGTD